MFTPWFTLLITIYKIYLYCVCENNDKMWENNDKISVNHGVNINVKVDSNNEVWKVKEKLDTLRRAHDASVSFSHVHFVHSLNT